MEEWIRLRGLKRKMVRSQEVDEEKTDSKKMSRR